MKHQDRADYGKHLIKDIAVDLGIARSELYRIVRFYRCYEIVATASRQLSWGHYVELIGIEEEHKRLFYQNKAVLNSWGIRDLREKVNAREFLPAF